MLLIALVLLVPLFGGLLLSLIRFPGRTARRVWVGAVTLTTSVLAAMLCLSPPTGTLRLLHFTALFSLGLRMDGLSRVFVGLLAFLWPLAVLYAFEYMTHEERENAFFAWYTISYAAVLGVAMAADLFTLYVFYEMLTLATLPLVTHKRDSASIHAGRKYLVYSLGGAAFGFAGLVILTAHGAGLDFRLGGGLVRSEGLDYTLLRAAFVLSFIGFSAKAALFPLHAWLPAASVAPTPVTALLHAVAVVNAGAWACLRLVFYSCGTDWLLGTWAQVIPLVLSAFTILFGSVQAVREQHFKRRLAWSTVSNLSYMLLGVALMTPASLTGTLTHLVNHGLMKITLFFCAGAVLVQADREYVQDLRGLGRVMPFTFGAFTLAAAALIGVPPFCGFLSKWNLLTAAAAAGPWESVVSIGALILSAILTAVYAGSVAVTDWFLPLNPESADLSNRNLDPGSLMKVPLLILCGVILLLGLRGADVTRFLSEIANGIL